MIESISQSLLPLSQKLIKHPIHNALKSKGALERFMTLHIYSVWDFMNLLKALQVQLTSISLPWQPSPNTRLARLINEIVLEEESDIINGKETSHFLFYCNAIKDIMGEVEHISLFLNDLYSGMSYFDLIHQEYIPKPARDFMSETYLITLGSVVELTSFFAFGRETLVPELFKPIKASIDSLQSKNVQMLINYLDRHIELDGEQHAKLSLEMVSYSAKTKEDWSVVYKTGVRAIKAREKLWDDILIYIQS